MKKQIPFGDDKKEKQVQMQRIEDLRWPGTKTPTIG